MADEAERAQNDRKISILYGSQTGTAQEIAERVGREAKRRFITAAVSSLDEYNVVSTILFRVSLFAGVYISITAIRMYPGHVCLCHTSSVSVPRFKCKYGRCMQLGVMCGQRYYQFRCASLYLLLVLACNLCFCKVKI